MVSAQVKLAYSGMYRIESNDLITAVDASWNEL
jgi:hypothetical protein